jgi:gas vesicle protein
MAQWQKGKGIFVGTLIGSVAGAVTALLFAPKAGRELRKDIAEGVSSMTEKTVEFYDKTIEVTGEWISSVKSWVSSVDDVEEESDVFVESELVPIAATMQGEELTDIASDVLETEEEMLLSDIQSETRLETESEDNNWIALGL